MEISRAQIVDLHREWLRWFVNDPECAPVNLSARLSVWFILSLVGIEHPIDDDGTPSLDCTWCGENPDLWR